MLKLTQTLSDDSGVELAKVEMSLTDEGLTTIEHIVQSHPAEGKDRIGVKWATHAFNALGLEGVGAVLNKINKYRASYVKAKAELGDKYMSAAELDAQETAKRDAPVTGKVK